MLVLSRKPGQQLRIGDSLVISILECGRNRVSIGIDAPPKVRVVRSEVDSLRPSHPAIACDSRSRRILIVDDNATDRELYRRFLSIDDEQPYQFVEADSAEMGLQLLDGAAPECVLLDYRLPDLNGVEFLAEWRRRRLPADCPVLMLTNFGSEELVVEALKGGAFDYLKKGTLTPELLRQRVHGAITQSKAYQTSA